MTWEIATTLLGGIATLAIFSFLWRENAAYRMFEHLYIGIAVGWGVVLGIKNFLWPNILVPLLGLDIVVFPDGTQSAPYNPLLLLYLFPMAFGLLYYTMYSVKYSWMAKVVIGFTLGASGGSALEGFANSTLPQVVGSFKPLIVVQGGAIAWWPSISNIVFVCSLLSVMYYFFFSFRARSAALQQVSNMGRWVMMVCFGAYFGSTVMARMALLVERVQFLVTDCWEALRQVFV